MSGAKVKKWESSLCFRRFRTKHTELNDIYWTHILGIEAIKSACASAPPESAVVDFLKSGVGRHLTWLKVGDIPSWDDKYCGRVRLHILVVCAATLEAYIKEITRMHLLASGYEGTPLKLKAVGEAMGSPILNRNSLPAPLRYAEELFGIDYGKAIEVWDKSYKLRCALAHNGGVVTARTINEIKDIGLRINEPITLTWECLRESLQAAYDIAALTDRKAVSQALKKVEIRQELHYLKESGQLPPRRKVWEYLHETFGLSNMKHLRHIDREFYV